MSSVAFVTIRDESGGLYFVTQVPDITERKRTELERETIIRILQIANEAAQPHEMIGRIFAEMGRIIRMENGIWRCSIRPII